MCFDAVSLLHTLGDQAEILTIMSAIEFSVETFLFVSSAAADPIYIKYFVCFPLRISIHLHTLVAPCKKLQQYTFLALHSEVVG